MYPGLESIDLKMEMLALFVSITLPFAAEGGLDI